MTTECSKSTVRTLKIVTVGHLLMIPPLCPHSRFPSTQQGVPKSSLNSSEAPRMLSGEDCHPCPVQPLPASLLTLAHSPHLSCRDQPGISS